MTFRKRNWKVMSVWLFFCESFSLFSVGIFSLPTVNKLRIFCHHIFWKCVWIFNREKRLYISIKISAAQFFAFFAKTKDGRAKDFSRKITCEKFAKKGPKLPKNRPKYTLKS